MKKYNLIKIGKKMELRIGDIVLIVGPKKIPEDKNSILDLGIYCWLYKMNDYIGKISIITNITYSHGPGDYFYLDGYSAYFYKDWLIRIG